jgi:hypothetical protein
MSLKVVKDLKANGGGNARTRPDFCALQNRDKHSNAPPRIGTAGGAASAHFKRLGRNFQSGRRWRKRAVTTISAAQSDSD